MYSKPSIVRGVQSKAGGRPYAGKGRSNAGEAEIQKHVFDRFYKNLYRSHHLAEVRQAQVLCNTDVKQYKNDQQATSLYIVKSNMSC